MSKIRARQYGFTVVELLIVIVVIGILAAIVIVAYNGIQDRAKLASRMAEMDRIGKAIELWTAEKGQSLENSNSGAGGVGYGYVSCTAITCPGSNIPYVTTSIETLLKDAGYLRGSVMQDSYLIALCNGLGDPRRVVMTEIYPAPSKPVRAQVTTAECPDANVDLYTNADYKKNLAKVY